MGKSLTFVVPGKAQAKQRHQTVAMTKCRVCGYGHRGQYRACKKCGGDLMFVANVPFTPAGTVMFENLVAITCRQAMQKAGFEQIREGAVALHVDFYIDMAETRRCKNHLVRREEGLPYLNGITQIPCKKLHEGDRHTQRPDADNLQKSLMDGLNTVLFADDAIVSEIHVRKMWGNEARAEVRVECL